MENIQSCIASKQPVSSGDWRFKPWTPGEGEMEDLETQVEGRNLLCLCASEATALRPQVVLHWREEYTDWALKSF